MAISLVTGSTVTANGIGANTTGNMAAPSGMGTGDIDLIAVVIGTGTGSTFSTPSGYTEIFQDVLDDSGVIGRMAAYYRAAEASPATAAVTWSSYARRFAAGRFRISGGDTGDIIDATGTYTEGTVAPNASPLGTITAVNSTTDNALALAFFGYTNGAVTGTPIFTASGWSDSGFNLTPYVGTDSAAACVLYKVLGAAGSSGSCAVDSGGTDATNGSWGGRIVTFTAGAVVATRRPVVVIM